MHSYGIAALGQVTPECAEERPVARVLIERAVVESSILRAESMRTS